MIHHRRQLVSELNVHYTFMFYVLGTFYILPLTKSKLIRHDIMALREDEQTHCVAQVSSRQELPDMGYIAQQAGDKRYRLGEAVVLQFCPFVNSSIVRGRMHRLIMRPRQPQLQYQQ